MEATELRIGNWVETIEGEIQIQNGWEIDEGNECSPIPLTKEWLDRFNMFNGKEYAYGNYTLRRGNYAISDIPDISDRGWSIGIESSEEWMFLVCVKYVHQLQNVIFALTAGDVLTEK